MNSKYMSEQLPITNLPLKPGLVVQRVYDNSFNSLSLQTNTLSFDVVLFNELKRSPDEYRKQVFGVMEAFIEEMPVGEMRDMIVDSSSAYYPAPLVLALSTSDVNKRSLILSHHQ